MTIKKPFHNIAAGQLDPLFGVEGFADLKSPDPSYDDYRTHVVNVGPDNKIYVAGQSSAGLNNHILTLARLNEDGLIDSSFADNGYYHNYFYRSDKSIFYTEQIAFAHDRILLIGTLFHWPIDGLRKDRAVACFHPDGSIDTDFGELGKFIFHVSNDNEHSLEHTAYNEDCLKLERSTYAGLRQSRGPTLNPPKTCTVSDEHILMLHDSGSFDAIHSFIIRLTHRGQLDRSFNQTGYVRVQHSEHPFLYLYSLTIDKFKNYISAGYVRANYNGIPQAVVLTRHFNDGKLDTSYQNDGFLLISAEAPNQFFILEKTITQINNRILCIGTVADKNDPDLMAGLLISREADGTANIQFNGGQPVITRMNSSSTFLFHAAFQSDGSFLVGGLADLKDNPNIHYVVTRFFYNGIQDKDFGKEGGWKDYLEAKNRVRHTCVFTSKGVLLSAENKDNDIISSAIARGLIP